MKIGWPPGHRVYRTFIVTSPSSHDYIVVILLSLNLFLLGWFSGDRVRLLTSRLSKAFSQSRTTRRWGQVGSFVPTQKHLSARTFNPRLLFGTGEVLVDCPKDAGAFETSGVPNTSQDQVAFARRLLALVRCWFLKNQSIFVGTITARGWSKS